MNVTERLPNRGLHLLMDDSVIESQTGCAMKAGQLQVENCKFVEASEPAWAVGDPSVRIRQIGESGQLACHAGQPYVSIDGSSWQADDAGLAALSLINDPDGDQSRLYKAANADGLTVSGDGMKWEQVLSLEPQSGCPAATLFWSMRARQYVCLYPTSNGLHVRTSEDFVKWSDDDAVDVQPRDDSQLVHLAPFRYAGRYIALATVRSASGNTTVEPMISRDGIAWGRPAIGENMLPNQAAGMLLGFPEPMLVDDNLRHFFMQTDESGKGSLCYADIPLDQFAGLTNSNAGEAGTITTKPLEVEGRSLQLSADIGEGQLSAELQKDNGEVLKGFSFDDCDPVTPTTGKITISWAGRRDLSQQLGRELKVVIRVTGATVYSVSFLGGS